MTVRLSSHMIVTTDELLLGRALGWATAEDHISWAVDQLSNGRDTPSLRVVAGLHATYERADVEPYFLQAAEELALDLPVGEPDPRAAAAIVRRLFEARSLAAEDTVARMADLYRLSEYSDPILGVWSDIEEELLLKGSGHEGVFYPPHRLLSLDDTVRLEWSLFARADALALPDEFHEFTRCDDCSHVGPLRREPPSLWHSIMARIPWRRRGPVIWFVCSRCGSPRYRGMSDPTVREDYFARLEMESG